MAPPSKKRTVTTLRSKSQIFDAISGPRQHQVTCKHYRVHQDAQKLKSPPASGTEDPASRDGCNLTASKFLLPTLPARATERPPETNHSDPHVAPPSNVAPRHLTHGFSRSTHTPFLPGIEIRTDLHKFYISRLFTVPLPCAHCIYLNLSEFPPLPPSGPKFSVSQNLNSCPTRQFQIQSPSISTLSQLPAPIMVKAQTPCSRPIKFDSIEKRKKETKKMRDKSIYHAG